MSEIKQLEMYHLEQSKDSFIEVANSQAKKGLGTYGKDIDPLDDYSWARMAKEELVDGFRYIDAMEQRTAFIVAKLRKLTSYKPTELTRQEINYWLDKLEGK